MKSSAIPFILSSKAVPAHREEPLYQALKPALTGLRDLHFTPDSGTEFFGSNIDFRESSISAGVHPAIRAQSAATYDDAHVTLLLCHRGAVEFRYGTRQRLALRPMKAALIKSHDWRAQCTDYGGVAIRMRKQSLASRVSLVLDRDVRVEELDDLDLASDAAYCLQRALQALQIAYRPDAALSGLFDDNILATVSLCVRDGRKGSAAEAGARFRHVVESARAVVRKDLKSPLPVAAIASQLNVSERYLQIAFQSVDGTTPKQWILLERLKSARREVLHNPSRSLARIAEDFSFSSPAHFSKAFRKVFGVSPQQMRSGDGN